MQSHGISSGFDFERVFRELRDLQDKEAMADLRIIHPRPGWRINLNTADVIDLILQAMQPNSLVCFTDDDLQQIAAAVENEQRRRLLKNYTDRSK